MTSSRLAVIVGCLAGASLTLASCTEEEAPPAASPSSTEPSMKSPSKSKPPANKPPAKDVTSCQDLLDANWSPPEGEPQLSYDPTSGVMEFLNGKRTIRVDLLHDRRCLDLPVYGDMFKHTLKQAKAFS